jgi:hypothetical protein
MIPPKQDFLKKFVFLIMTLTLLIPLFSNVNASAETQEILYKESFTEKVKGVQYEVETAEYQDFIVTTVRDKKGFQKFATNKSTGHVTVTSDYLKGNEVEEAEKSVNELAIQLDKQIEQQKTSAPIPQGEFGTESVVGSYVWSSWKWVTVTYASKASYATITAAILSRIPYIGWVAGATAAVLINYSLPVGYLKYRMGTARDTHPDYVWIKKTVNVYRYSDRTGLLSSKTSNPQKVRVY